MSTLEFFTKCLEHSYAAVTRSVEGLTPEELSWRPKADCMSIGFIVWHYGRVLDLWPSRIDGVPQVWEQGWAEKFDRAPADPKDAGFGFTPEQLDAFVVPSESVLVGYAYATCSRLKQWLETQSEDAVDELSVPIRKGNAMSLSTLFQQLAWELNQHGGQIAYLRGMQRGIEDRMFSGPALEAAMRGD